MSGSPGGSVSRATGTCVAPDGAASPHHDRRMSNHERELRSGTDWRELIASLLLAAAIGMFTVYGLVYFMRAMM